MRDFVNNFSVAAAVVPQVLTATNTSAAIDLAGFDGATVVINGGAIVGAGNFTPKLTECATSGGTYTDVAAADLIGTFPAVLLTNTVVKVGYKGSKQFLKTVLTLNSGTSLAASVEVIKGWPKSSPAA
jgi:hypothetical protein